MKDLLRVCPWLLMIIAMEKMLPPFELCKNIKVALFSPLLKFGTGCGWCTGISSNIACEMAARHPCIMYLEKYQQIHIDSVHVTNQMKLRALHRIDENGSHHSSPKRCSLWEWSSPTNYELLQCYAVSERILHPSIIILDKLVLCIGCDSNCSLHLRPQHYVDDILSMGMHMKDIYTASVHWTYRICRDDH